MKETRKTRAGVVASGRNEDSPPSGGSNGSPSKFLNEAAKQFPDEIEGLLPRPGSSFSLQDLGSVDGSIHESRSRLSREEQPLGMNSLDTMTSSGEMPSEKDFTDSGWDNFINDTETLFRRDDNMEQIGIYDRDSLEPVQLGEPSTRWMANLGRLSSGASASSSGTAGDNGMASSGSGSVSTTAMGGRGGSRGRGRGRNGGSRGGAGVGRRLHAGTKPSRGGSHVHQPPMGCEQEWGMTLQAAAAAQRSQDQDSTMDQAAAMAEVRADPQTPSYSAQQSADAERAAMMAQGGPAIGPGPGAMMGPMSSYPPLPGGQGMAIFPDHMAMAGRGPGRPGLVPQMQMAVGGHGPGDSEMAYDQQGILPPEMTAEDRARMQRAARTNTRRDERRRSSAGHNAPVQPRRQSGEPGQPPFDGVAVMEGGPMFRPAGGGMGSPQVGAMRGMAMEVPPFVGQMGPVSMPEEFLRRGGMMGPGGGGMRGGGAAEFGGGLNQQQQHAAQQAQQQQVWWQQQQQMQQQQMVEQQEQQQDQQQQAQQQEQIAIDFMQQQLSGGGQAMQMGNFIQHQMAASAAAAAEAQASGPLPGQQQGSLSPSISMGQHGGGMGSPSTSSQGAMDQQSREATSLENLKTIIEKLDLPTRKAIKDSIYRLAFSAMERSGGEGWGPAATAVEFSRLRKTVADAGRGEKTNDELDRSVANLLYDTTSHVPPSGGAPAGGATPGGPAMSPVGMYPMGMAMDEGGMPLMGGMQGQGGAPLGVLMRGMMGQSPMGPGAGPPGMASPLVMQQQMQQQQAGAIMMAPGRMQDRRGGGYQGMPPGGGGAMWRG